MDMSSDNPKKESKLINLQIISINKMLQEITRRFIFYRSAGELKHGSRCSSDDETSGGEGTYSLINIHESS